MYRIALHRLLVAALVLLCPDPGFAAEASVRLAGRPVLQLGDSADLSGPERASRASDALGRALEDPTCGPEGVVVRREEGIVTIVACERLVLTVQDVDAARLGVSVEEAAAEWAGVLGDALGEQKRDTYAARLLRRALVGLLIPIGFVAAIALVRTIFRRIHARLVQPSEGARGLRLGPLQLLATNAERRFVAGLLLLVRLALYAVLAYAFLVVLFRQLPTTQEWAARMSGPVLDLVERLGAGLIDLVPRLLVLAALIVGVRLTLRSIDRLFDQVRVGQLRFEPLLSVETAAPTEQTARIVVVAVGILLAGLVLPGAGGLTLQAVLLLGGVALALGAQRGAANLLGGLLVIYGRPFRTGQRVRIGRWIGTVDKKGLLHTILRTAGAGRVLVPNRLAMEQVVAILETPRRITGSLVVEAPRGEATVIGLIRSAASAAHLRAEDETIRVSGVREGALVFEVSWPLPHGTTPPEAVSALLSALLDRAPQLDVTIREATFPSPTPS